MSDSNLPALESIGPSDFAATSDNAIDGPKSLYAAKDFVHAQIPRRWSLDWGKFGARNDTIVLHSPRRFSSRPDTIQAHSTRRDQRQS